MKNNLQTLSALMMLVAGLGFALAGFITPPPGEISDSVLWLFSQCIIYAGSIFWVGAYFKKSEESDKSDLSDQSDQSENL